MQFIGVIHLRPLPGSPRGEAFDDVLRRATADARALKQGGAEAVVVENFGCAPFSRGAVDPYTVAAMTRLALAVREETQGMRLGINVLRNDAVSALSIASAVGADFIRVNVLVGAMVTDQGLIEGDARGLLMERKRLQSPVEIAADVLVKHAVPLGAQQIENVAKDTALRGLADVLIVTGTGTGAITDPSRVAAVKQAVPSHPVWIGSGITPENAGAYDADGAIVGSWLHRDGKLEEPLDVRRVEQMARVLRN